MLGIDWPLAADMTTVGAFLMDIVMVGALLWGALSGLPRLVNHAQVVSERNRLRDEHKDLRAALLTAAQISSLNHSAIDEMRTRIEAHEIRAAATEERLEARLDEALSALLDAIKYSTDLTEAVLSHGDPHGVPKPPDSLSEKIRQEMMARMAARAMHAQEMR